MILHKNKNKSIFTPSRLVFREGPAKLGPTKSAPRPAPSKAPSVKQAPTPTPALSAQSGIESLKVRLKTAGLDERRKLSLDILATAETNQDRPSIDFAKAEIQKYCAEKRAEIKKKYEQLVLEVYRSAKIEGDDDDKEVELDSDKIEKLRLKEEEELAQYTVEFVVAGIALNNFETLPVDEQTMLLEASSFQQIAIDKYRLQKDKEDKDGGDTDLYLKDEELAEIHGITSASLAKDYSAVKIDKDVTDVDAAFYNTKVGSYENDVSSASHGYPHGRILSRQTALEFLKGRGDKLHPVIKARIYIDIANSLLYELTRDRDLELAKKFLVKAITIMEAFRNANPKNFEELSPFGDDQSFDTTLGYAYYRYAGLLKEQSKKSNKPDETVCQWYEKAAGEGWSTDYQYSGGTEIWVTDYIDYLLQFPNTLDKAISVINRHWTKEDPYLTKGGAARVLERLRIQIHNSKNFQEFKENRKKFSDITEKLPQDKKRDTYDYYKESDNHHAIVEQWYGPDSSKEKRAELFGFYISGSISQTNESRDQLVSHYKNSPVVGKNYKFIVENHAGIEPFKPTVLIKKADEINRIRNIGIPKTYLLHAHLFDDWAPKGQVDRKKALELYRQALNDRTDLDNTEIADAIARCYRILNAPQSYTEEEYLMAATDIGERPTPTWEKDLNEKGARFEIEDPKDNMVVLFYDAKQNIGIVINRYVNVAAFSTAYNKGDYLKKLAERKRLKKEQKSTEKIETEIAELEKKLTPEGIGDIYYFTIGPKGMEIHFDIVYHIKQKEREHLEYLENSRNAVAVNAHDFPFEGFSADTMGLYRNFHDFSGHNKLRKNGWMAITDDDGKYLYLDGNNNIIQVNPETHDKHEK